MIFCAFFCSGRFYLYIYARRGRGSWRLEAGRATWRDCRQRGGVPRLDRARGAAFRRSGWSSSTGRPARRGVPPRGASLRGEPSNLNGCGRVQSLGRVQMCRAADVCKCAGLRTCASVQGFGRVQMCRASGVCKCAEMCKPVRLNIRRCVTTCVTNVWTCANVQGLGRVQMCGAQADVRSSPQMWEFRHIVATSTAKVYE